MTLLYRCTFSFTFAKVLSLPEVLKQLEMHVQQDDRNNCKRFLLCSFLCLEEVIIHKKECIFRFHTCLATTVTLTQYNLPRDHCAEKYRPHIVFERPSTKDASREQLEQRVLSGRWQRLDPVATVF